MITPFLMLVLSGYAVFVAVLGTVSLRQALWERRLANAKRPERS